MNLPESKALDLSDAKVLVVGAGGIGCELLKNLVLSGCKHIEVVDLDTIELSNLNRQFLFRRHHLGQSKAQVAAEAVQAMCKHELHIVPHFANIKDTSKFPLAFFESFHIVLNALDNLDARRYVNNMCLTVNVPLVESGTAGYFGQTSVIIPRQTECFDCQPKEAPKTYAICTIRNTPTLPIHCIVWAKEYLLPNLFGEQATEEPIPEDTDPKLVEMMQKEAKAFQALRTLIDPQQYAEAVFNKIFHHDILALLQMEDLWKTRAPPTPLSFITMDVEWREPVSDQEVWPVEDWHQLFIQACMRLKQRSSVVEWDKDDADVLDLVAAVANLRAKIFGVAMTSRFQIKSMAGNIIPAIATTNAIAAGMIVIQARNLLLQRTEHCCTVHRIRLSCNIYSFTLQNIVDDVIHDEMKQVECEDLVINHGQRIIYDEVDEFTSMAPRALSQIGINSGDYLRVECGEEAIMIAVTHDDSFEETDYQVEIDPIPEDQRRKEEEPELPDAKEAKVDLSEEDDLQILE